MKRLFSVVTASLVISLATSTFAMSSGSGVNSKIASTPVVMKAIPTSVAQDKKRAEKIARKRERSKDYVMAFRDQHPKLAHALFTHQGALNDRGISPVQLIKNRDMLKERINARQAK